MADVVCLAFDMLACGDFEAANERAERVFSCFMDRIEACSAFLRHDSRYFGTVHDEVRHLLLCCVKSNLHDLF